MTNEGSIEYETKWKTYRTSPPRRSDSLSVISASSLNVMCVIC